MALGTEAGAAFIDLMRRYVVDYTNRHDQAVTVDLMEPDYMLHMGEHVVRGRDGPYRSATAKQMSQFPGLVLTVHEIATSGDRLVMRFSEHGASRRHDDRRCVWNGIGLYAWNGRKLARNYVEQDYFSRREQLRKGVAAPVDSPALAPWDTVAEAPDPGSEAVVRAWLEAGRVMTTPTVLLDGGVAGETAAPLIEQTSIEFNDFFSCGPTVAFHAVQRGRFVPGDGIRGERGAPAFLHMTGCVRVERDTVSGRVVTNRLDLERRLSRRSAA